MPLHRHFQCFDDQSTLLRRKTALDDEASIGIVVVIQLTIVVLLLREVGISQSLHHSILRDDFFYVMGSAVLRKEEQFVLDGLVRNSSDGANFGVAQCTRGEPRIDLRQSAESIGNSNPLACRVHADATFEIEPMCTGMKTEPLPAFGLVELTNQGKQAMLGRIDIAAKFGNFGPKTFALLAREIVLLYDGNACPGHASLQ